MNVPKDAVLRVCGDEYMVGDTVLGWPIARDCVLRGHIKRAELRGGLGKRLEREANIEGLVMVVESELLGVRVVRFEK